MSSAQCRALSDLRARWVGGLLDVVEGGPHRALPARDDLSLRFRAAHPAADLDFLTGLQGLIDLEEVLDLQAVEFRYVVDVAEMTHPRVRRGHAEHLVIQAVLIP